MSRALRLTRAAEADLQEAADWYRDQSEPAALRFRLAIDEALDRIRENPLAYSKVRGTTRRALTHGFPYSVFFRLQAETILVIAIIHQARNPRVWQRRI
ncbi:MAG TPA: type II toxin-antitoxin system RelE/ParE family toxin [Thermoanaerobaculia bacterium]|nr:type II toxin-antitoxin system RelE/ParE family toxin [Thermoanaerobaculia bacterium]